MRLIFTLLLLAASAFAQTALNHSVTLNWADALNPAGTTYSIYRAQGLCSGAPTFSKLAAAVTAKAYEDTTVTPGNYCYQVTAVFAGVESAPSNTAVAAVPTFPPDKLTATPK